MIPAILGVVAAALTLTNTIIDRFFPKKHVPTLHKFAKMATNIPQKWIDDQEENKKED